MFTSTEILMMDRSQNKTLRTIFGFPTHISVAGLHLLCGTLPIQYILMSRQLSFIHNTLALPDSAISKQLLLYRVSASAVCPSSSVAHKFQSTLELLSLPSISDLSLDLPSKLAWKALTKTIIHETFQDASLENPTPSLCHHISQLSLPQYGRPSDVLHVYNFHHNLCLARKSITRMRFLLHTCYFTGIPYFPL